MPYFGAILHCGSQHLLAGRDATGTLCPMQADRKKGRQSQLRNVRVVNTTHKNVRLDRYRALLPLGPGQGQHSIGDFDTEEVSPAIPAAC